MVAAVVACFAASCLAAACRPAQPREHRGDTYVSLAQLPDWSGAWVVPLDAFLAENGRQRIIGDPASPPLTPAFAEILERQRRDSVTRQATNAERCLPNGMPNVMRYAFAIEFLFTPGRVTILLEQDSMILASSQPNGYRLTTPPTEFLMEDTMTKRVVAAVSVLALIASVAFAEPHRKRIREFLTGYEETPLALSTTGKGTFVARLDLNTQEIEYELSYADLEAEVTQAHIHFGSTRQSGGISVFLCTNLGNGPAGTQLCPAQPATITGTITPSDVIGAAAQGIAAGEFAELMQAIQNGVTYVNVHTTKYPAGEIRAQLR